MISVISLLYFLFFAVEVQNQYVDILDLTTGDKIISSAHMTWGTGGGSNHSRPMVSVTLKLDKERYVLGEEFTYEIGIKNISGKEIQIPWDTDGDKINNGNTSYSYEDLPAGFMKVSASLWIRNDDDNRNDSLLESNRLYGSDAFTSSIKILKPEESVMIRATGRWNRDKLNDNILSRVNDNSSVTLEIYVFWHFSYGIDIIAYKDASYSTPIKIELEIPPDEETE